MTDVRQTSATLVLGEDLDGRFFIRNAAHELVVELYKPRGRKVELGVEPGAYEVRIEQTKGSLLAKTQIADGGRVVLEPRQFGVTTVEATRPRGGAESGRFAVAGRHRIELQAGMWQMAASHDTVNIGSGSIDEVVGLNYTHYVREDLGMTMGVQTAAVAMGISSSRLRIVHRDGLRCWRCRSACAGIHSAPGRAARSGRFSPRRSGRRSGSARASSTATRRWLAHTARRRSSRMPGVGLDYFPARSFAIGVNGGYDWMANFARPVGSQRNLSGPEVNFNFGWLFGHGRLTRYHRRQADAALRLSLQEPADRNSRRWCRSAGGARLSVVRERRSRAAPLRLLVLGAVGRPEQAARRAVQKQQASQKADHAAYQEEIEKRHLDDDH